jgi:hypothetical protein
LWGNSDALFAGETKTIALSVITFEPFIKVVEWFDFQVNMEEVYRFPLLRLKSSDALTFFVIPAFAGITGSAIASIPPCRKSFKTIHPDFIAVYPILFQEACSILGCEIIGRSGFLCLRSCLVCPGIVT